MRIHIKESQINADPDPEDSRVDAHLYPDEPNKERYRYVLSRRTACLGTGKLILQVKKEKYR
jgi:hypothetical protein